MFQYFLLLIGVFVISWSSILVRWLGDVHPLVITFYRLFFSVLILAPYIRLKKENIRAQTPSTRQILYFVLAGLLLALHFFSWIKSLQMTTVGHSIFLESTHPIFALILSYFVLKERSSWLTVSGIGLALLGMYIIVSADQSTYGASFTGDLLAIFSAFCLAAYLLIARMFTKKIPLLPYLVRVYGIAAIITLFFLLLQRIDFLRLSMQDWFFLILMALGPNLLGHSLLNWAARKMPVYLVNLGMQGEAVLATIYAALLLNEHPASNFYAGAVLIVIAVSFIFVTKK